MRVFIFITLDKTQIFTYNVRAMPIPHSQRMVIEKAAKPLYQDWLPYHNFPHALEAFRQAEKIMGNCIAAGIPVKEFVVYLTLILHDAGYGHDHKKLGFETKEDYSVHLAKPFLEQFGVDDATINEVCRTILATKKDGTFQTTEEKIVRSADLAGLAIDYPTFLKNNLKLKAEAEMLSGQSISWQDWKRKSSEIIQFYLSQDIRLTPAYANEQGESVFHKRTRANLALLLEEGEPKTIHLIKR